MIWIYYNHKVFAYLVSIYHQYLCQKKIQHQVVCSLRDHTKQQLERDLYIMFGFNIYDEPVIPKHMVVIQLEQSKARNWFGDLDKPSDYIKNLSRAQYIWEYSINNYQWLKKLAQQDLLTEQIYYVPIGGALKPHKPPTGPKPIDILFIGAMNPRRVAILQQLANHPRRIKVEIYTDLWGQEKIDKIHQAKFVLNIHYYQDAILETVRLTEVLSEGTAVISEYSSDKALDKIYGRYIDLVPTNQLVTRAIELVEAWKGDPQPFISKVRQYQQEKRMDAILDSAFARLPDMYKSIENPREQPIPDLPVEQPFRSVPTVTVPRGKGEEILAKLPPLPEGQWPKVSVVTITRGRPQFAPLMVFNWKNISYPRDRLEWIILDDSHDDIYPQLRPHIDQLPSEGRSNIHYIHLDTPIENLGQKRNQAIQYTNGDIIAFMDDDDMYYPDSIINRVKVLTRCQCTGVNQLDVYDLINQGCYRIMSDTIAEASMAFWKSFWLDRPFASYNSIKGESVPFLKHRHNCVQTLPSCFVMIAVTHGRNYTGDLRSNPNNRGQLDYLHLLSEEARQVLHKCI